MKHLRALIRVEIHAITDELRQLKRWRRLPPDDRPPPPVTTLGLHAAKQRATLLCTIMAHSRGRVHAHGGADLDAQARLLSVALARMDAMTWQRPILDPSLRATMRAILARTSACIAPTEEHRA